MDSTKEDSLNWKLEMEIGNSAMGLRFVGHNIADCIKAEFPELGFAFLQRNMGFTNVFGVVGHRVMRLMEPSLKYERYY